jgi:hypothetical protein
VAQEPEPLLVAVVLVFLQALQVQPFLVAVVEVVVGNLVLVTPAVQ